MRDKVLFTLAAVGIISGLISAYIYGIEKKPEPPKFAPASNPYGKGIYANGIIESYQEHGENINVYPEVAGTVSRIEVAEGESVAAGVPLFALDDSVQAAAVAQLKAQAEAAGSLLDELKAQPRPETLEVAAAQVEASAALLKSAQDQLDKQLKSYRIEPRSVSGEALDNARNAVQVAKANLEVARKQRDLIKAGAWSYDIRTQENQFRAATKAYQAAQSLLAKYTVKAPSDGVVLAINVARGSYVSPQGAYDTYTQGSSPVLVMGRGQRYLGVRCYIDEILVHRLPKGEGMKSRMFIRGTGIDVPLEFVRVQPYISPKIALSNQRTERVDVRVLPVIFRFQKPERVSLYPGQLVDVYIGEK